MGSDKLSSTDGLLQDSDPKKFNLPTRLDRLIAFLDSYFGQVELIVPDALEESSVPTEIPLGEEPTEGEEKKMEDVVVERTLARVPVIRVRLDENFADVTVEDLVRIVPYFERG